MDKNLKNIPVIQFFSEKTRWVSLLLFFVFLHASMGFAFVALYAFDNLPKSIKINIFFAMGIFFFCISVGFIYLYKLKVFGRNTTK